jgi:peptidyl-dipeptidase Dcp
VALNNQGDFDGLPEGLRKAAMAQAKRNLNVLGVIGNTRSFVEPFLTFSNDRERAKVWSMYVKVTMKMNSTIKPPLYRFCS